MKYSFIVLNLNNQIEQKTITDYFKDNYDNGSYEIIYCSSTKAKRCANLKNYIFEKNENSESILNSVLKYCTGENICVIRNVNGYNYALKLTNKLKKDNQIVFCKKELSKVKQFFWNIFKKIAKFLFLQNLEPINQGVVLYGKLASSVLKELQRPAIAIKANMWEGIENVYLSGGAIYKFSYNIKSKIAKTFIPLLIAVTYLYCHY